MKGEWGTRRTADAAPSPHIFCNAAVNIVRCARSRIIAISTTVQDISNRIEKTGKYGADAAAVASRIDVSTPSLITDTVSAAVAAAQSKRNRRIRGGQNRRRAARSTVALSGTVKSDQAAPANSP